MGRTSVVWIDTDGDYLAADEETGYEVAEFVGTDYE